MNKCLILFTSKYPHGKGEEFLESELKYLTTAFDRIIIFNNTDAGTKRELPQNVTVKTINFNSIEIKKLDKLRSLKKKEFYYMSVKSYLRNAHENSFYSRLMRNMRIIVKYEYYIQKIMFFLKDEQISLNDCVFYSYWFSNNAVLLYLLKEQFKNIKVVSRAHNTDIYEWNSRWESLFPLYKISRRMNSIVFISNHARKYFLRMQDNLLRSTAVVSRLGVRGFENHSVLKNREKLRIISVSNIVNIKRIDLIIDALGFIGEKIEWRHIGEGKLSRHIRKYACEKLSNRSNINYEFEGYIPNKYLNKVYINYNPHLIINVSSREGVPVSIMEAMSFGIPAIAIDTGGNSEIVSNKNGVLLNAESNPKEISKAILFIKHLSNEKYRKMCKNAKETWISEYSAEHNYKKFIKILKNI